MSGHHAPVRHVRLSFAVAAALTLGTSGCTQDEASQQNCNAGAKCAPWSLVNSNRLSAICMTVTPNESTVGAVVDSAATIGLSSQHTPTVAYAAMVDREVVQGFYILTPADPICGQPTPRAPTSALAYDPSSYSVDTLDRLLHR